MTNSTNPIQLEVFKHRFAAIAEEMGAVLRKIAIFTPMYGEYHGDSQSTRKI